MSNKQFIVTFFFLLCSVTVIGQIQQKAIICHLKGMLVDTITNEAEPYVNIVIRNRQYPDEHIKMSITDINGKFNIGLDQAAEYIATFSLIGKKDIIRNFMVRSDIHDVNLGTIYMSNDIKTLKEVEVVSRRKLVKVDIDKIEYLVENDPRAAVSTTFDMLHKVPYISVNGLDEIKVMGSTNFKIYINGHPAGIINSDNVAEFLKNMPAGIIKSIQVITTPDAKYDAEGASIINIVKRKLVSGYSVSSSTSISNTYFYQSLYGIIQTDKFSLTGNVSLNKHAIFNPPHNYVNSVYDNHLMNTKERSFSDLHRTPNWMWNPGIDVSYEIDSLRLLTGNFMCGNFMSIAAEGDNQIEMLDNNGNSMYSYGYDNYYKIKTNNWSVMCGYQRKFQREDELLSFSYQHNSLPKWSKEYTDYKNILNDTLPYLGIWTDSKPTLTENTFQSDYSYPFSKKQKMDVGLKILLRNTKNHFYYYGRNGSTDYEENVNLGRNYNQSQNIYSIYGEYNIKGEKWSAKGGLRYEYTHLKSMDNHSSEFTNSYGNIVPNVSVIWKINSFNLLNISYKLYISRPNVSSLDPHVNNTDSKNIYYGNPQLKCEKEHNMSLSYNYSGDKMDCGLTSNFSLTENTINSYVYAEKDVLHHTYRNIGRLTVFNVHTYANANITSHLSANFDAYWSYVKYKQEAMGINAESPSFYGVNGGLELSLPWNLNLNLDAEWDSKEIEAQGKISSQYSYNLVLYRSFMKRHLTISLVASNFISKYLNTWSLREMPDYRYYSESHRYARGFRMTIAYRFGKLNKQVKKAQYSINNTDLKKDENDSSSVF